jgi:hypothetical protein
MSCADTRIGVFDSAALLPVSASGISGLVKAQSRPILALAVHRDNAL